MRRCRAAWLGRLRAIPCARHNRCPSYPNPFDLLAESRRGPQSEWAEAILALDQLVVEGFRATKLQDIAESLGAVPDKKWASINLLTACLEHGGAAAEQARAAMQPLHHLHRLRTVTKGHATKGEKSNATSDALREHGSFRAHFESLAAGCDNALQTILDAFDPSPA